MNSKINDSGKQRFMMAVFKECAPQVFEACELLSQPLITNWALLPNVYHIIQQIEGATTCENIHVVIATLDRLFVPVQLIGNQVIKKPVGLRDAYSNLLGFNNPEMVNHYMGAMRPHYKNPRFAERIDTISFEVYDHLKRNGDIMENYPVFAPCAHPFENIKTDGFFSKMVKNRVSGLRAHIEGAENALLH